jgi:hypothetical protein
MAHKLFIGGLAFSTSHDRLREVFAQAGAVAGGGAGGGGFRSRGGSGGNRW